MKRISYIALCLLLLTGLVFCFVACGENDGDINSSTESSGNTTNSTDDSKNDTSSTDSSAPVSSSTTNASTKDPEEDDGTHKHTYSSEYSYDAINHFFKATCEHTEEIRGLEAHKYNNGVCKCGRIKDDIEDAIARIIANKGVITGGTSEYTTNNVILSSISTTNVTYRFYENYVYVKEVGDYTNEYYYSYDNEKLVAIFVQNGGNVNVDTEAAEDSLDGAKYNFACLGEYESYACGGEKLIEFLYNYGAEKNPDKIVSNNEGNTYNFSYYFCVIDDWADYYYQVNVSFTIDEASKALLSTDITVNRYTKESYTVIEDDYILNDDAEPNFETTFKITQTTTPNKVVENPYDSSKVLLDSVKVKDRNGNNIEDVVISQRADIPVKIFLSDITPNSALLELCDIVIEVKDKKDGTIVTSNTFFNSFDNSYSFYVQMPGTYELFVKVNDMTFTSTLEIAPKIPVSISAQVYDAVAGVFTKSKRVELFAGSPLYFMSFVESGYDGAYSASIISDNASDATITDGTIDGISSSIFNTTVIGDYMIEIRSTADEDVVCQLRVSVVDAPSIDEYLVGEYYINDGYGKKLVGVKFDSQGAFVEITYSGDYGEEYTKLSYAVVDGEIRFEYVDGDEFVDNLYMNNLYQLIIEIYENEYVLQQIPVEKELVASGTLTLEDIVGEGKYSQKYDFELYSNGEFIFYKSYSKTRAISMSLKNGQLIFKFTGVDKQPLVKISGDQESLAGEYKIDGVANVLITIDDVAKPVEETKNGTIEIVDKAQYGKFDAVYNYEIIDGEYVIYKDGQIVTELVLINTGSGYSLLYPGVASAQPLEKIDGSADTLGGKYVIEMNLGQLITIAEVIIVPGAKAPEKPVIIEDPYGTFVLEDINGGGLSGTYTYEIVDGAFVIYKDGVLTNDVMIIVNIDGSYSFQCINLMVPQPLDKVNGEDGALAGKYEVYTETACIYSIVFMPGTLEKEEESGTLVIDDKKTGTLSGTYTYEMVEGAFVFTHESGTKIEGEFFIQINLDGTYSFQCESLMIPQVMKKVEGISVLLQGTYIVENEGESIYSFTFTPDKA